MNTTVPVISAVALVVRTVSSTAVFAGIGIPVGAAGAIAAAVVGLAIGLTHGIAIARARAYPAVGRGWWLLVVDHTWSLPNTCVASVFLVLNLIFGNRIDFVRSNGRSTVVLRNRVIPGYATTLGNVEAGTSDHTAAHEYVHVFQARLLGPLYFPLVGLNYVIATILPYWLLYHDRDTRPIRTVTDYFKRGVYPHVWNEEWAYRVDDRRS